MTEIPKDQEQKKNRIPAFFATLNGGYDRSTTALDRTYLTKFSVDKAAIKRAIENKNVIELRKYSQYFFHSSGEYRRLVEYFAKLLTFDYVVLPITDEKSTATPRFEKSFKTILDYSNKAHIQETGRQIAHTVVKDGAFYGYERVLNDDYILQQLPTSFCRTRFKIDGNFAVEFDFSFFDSFRSELEKAEAFKSFPPEFEGMYKAYLANRQLYQWQLLNSEFTRAHMLTDEVPFLSAILPDLMELEDYKGIEKQRVQQQTDQLIVQKVPTDEEGGLTMELEEIKTLHDNAKGMVAGTNKRVLTTPAVITTLDFKDSTSALQDDVEKATKMVYGSAGTPMMLFSSGTKSGSIGLDRSIQVDESLMFELLDQFQRWYEERFRNLVPTNKNFSFDILFPPITIFNRKQMWDMYQAGATQGFPTKLLSMAALGVNQTEMSSLLFYENEILGLHEKMIPTSTSYTQPGEGEGEGATPEGGKPKSEKPLTDEGQKTADQEKNKNRAKGGK